MAHASIPLPKAGWAFSTDIVSSVYNTNRPIVPAAWMAGDSDGQLSGIQINSTSRIAIQQMTISIPVGGDLISSFETGGTWILSYAGFQARIAINVDSSPDALGSQYFYSTSSLTATSLKWRTIWEKLKADNDNGGLTEDPVLTLWDRQGDDPVPAEVVTITDEQTISTPASAFSRNTARFAIVPATPRPQFNAVFAPSGADRFLEQFLIRQDRDGLLIHLGDDANAALSASPGLAYNQDFLDSGHIEITLQAEGSTAAHTAKVRLDTAVILDRGAIDEPYRIDWPTGTVEAIEIYSLVSWVLAWQNQQRFSADLKFGLIAGALKAAVAPTLTIATQIPTGANAAISTDYEAQTIRLATTLADGTYDRVTSVWEYSTNPTDASPTWTQITTLTDAATPTDWVLPLVDADTAIKVRCTVTAHGDGTNASDGSSAEVSAVADFTIANRASAVVAPNWDSPALKVTTAEGATITSATEGETVQLHPLYSGGTYDTVAIRWRYRIGSGAWVVIAAASPDVPFEWTLPEVTGDTAIRINCRADFNSDGTKVDPGAARKRPSQQNIDFTVNDTVVLPDAAAPTSLLISGAADGDEGTTVQIFALIAGGEYDDISYEWFVYEGDSLSGTNIASTVLDDAAAVTPTFTRPTVDADTNYTIAVEVTVTGDGTTAKANTSDSKTSASATMTVIDTTLAAVAPTSAVVNSVADGFEGRSVKIGVTISGGSYDTIEYAWKVHKAGAGNTITGANLASTVLDDPTIAAPTFTRPAVNANTSYSIDVIITVRGTGTIAKAGTSALIDANAWFTGVFVLPAVSPPNIQMTLDGTVFTDGASINGDEGTTSNLSVDLSGGTYDTIAYIWEVKKLGQNALLQPAHRGKDFAWQRPAVHGRNEIVTVSVEISVNGNGTNAKAGNVRTQSLFHNTTIFNLVDDGIFILGHEKTTHVYSGDKEIKKIYQGDTLIETFS